MRGYYNESSTGWEGVEWINLAQERHKWRGLVNTTANLRVPQNTCRFRTSQQRLSYTKLELAIGCALPHLSRHQHPPPPTAPISHCGPQLRSQRHADDTRTSHAQPQFEPGPSRRYPAPSISRVLCVVCPLWYAFRFIARHADGNETTPGRQMPFPRDWSVPPRPVAHSRPCVRCVEHSSHRATGCMRPRHTRESIAYGVLRYAAHTLQQGVLYCKHNYQTLSHYTSSPPNSSSFIFEA